jgi:hypothetical protein
MAKKESFNVGAMKLAQKIDGYGKNSDTDVITIATDLENATITAIGAGKQLLGGDFIYVYPVRIGKTAYTSLTNETLTFDVNYYKAKKYFLTKSISVTFSSPVDLNEAITQIETEMTNAGIAGKLDFVNANNYLRIQATDMKINFKITGGTALTALGLSVGDDGQPLVYKVAKNVGIADTNIQISELYAKNVEDFNFTESLSNLEYKVLRHIGECTGATLTASLTADTYKGSNKIAVQTEYGEGEAKLSINELVWNRDNLKYLKGWKFRDTGVTFFSGASADERYKYGEYSYPIEFSLVGFTVNNVGDTVELQHLECERCKAPSFTITMSKQYRTMSEELMLLANQDRAFAVIYTI